MKLTKFLFLLFVGTLFTLGIWLSIIITIDPFSVQNDTLTTAAFFASLMLWMSGFITFILFYIRINLTDSPIPFLSQLYQSLRHAIVISLAFSAGLSLQHLNVLGPMEALLIFVICVLVELIFKTRTSFLKSAETIQNI